MIVKAFILEPRGPFYGYIPTSLTLYRALCALEKSGLISLRDGFFVSGIFAYDETNDLIYVPANPWVLVLDGCRMGNEVIKVPEDVYVPFESSNRPYFTLKPSASGYEVRLEYPFVLTLSSRVKISRSSFTSYGTGRVVYNRMYLPKLKLVILTDLDKNVIRLLGELGVGNYKSIGGGSFEISEEREAEIRPISINKTLEGESLVYSFLDFPLDYGVGNVREMRTKILGKYKIVRYLAGGLIKRNRISGNRPHDFRQGEFPKITDCPQARLVEGFPVLK